MTEHTPQRKRWSPSERAAFLATVPVFSQLPPTTLKDLALRFQPKYVRRGQVLFLEGEPADAMNLVAEGRVKVVRHTDGGREVILRVIGPGEIFGVVGGWGEEVYPASAVAMEMGSVLQLPALEFTRLVGTHPDFALAIIRELAQRLREAESRIRDLQTEGVERRIARVLLHLASKSGVETAFGIEIQMPLSRQDLAEMAGTTLSTASRTVSAWHRSGIVAAGREKVSILRPGALAAIANGTFSPAVSSPSTRDT